MDIDSNKEMNLDLPRISLATLYNCYEIADNSQVVQKEVFLKPISLKESEFFSLFFSTNSKKFFINKSHRNNDYIKLSSQTYEDESKSKNFHLIDEILNSLSGNKTEKSIEPKKIFELQKEVKNIDSLANICGLQISTSWNEVLDTLITNDVIQEKSYCHHDIDVLFQVNLNYYSKSTNINLSIVFQYQVNIFELFTHLTNENNQFKETKIVKRKNTTVDNKNDLINKKKIIDSIPSVEQLLNFCSFKKHTSPAVVDECGDAVCAFEVSTGVKSLFNSFQETKIDKLFSKDLSKENLMSHCEQLEKNYFKNKNNYEFTPNRNKCILEKEIYFDFVIPDLQEINCTSEKVIHPDIVISELELQSITNKNLPFYKFDRKKSSDFISENLINYKVFGKNVKNIQSRAIENNYYLNLDNKKSSQTATTILFEKMMANKSSLPLKYDLFNKTNFSKISFFNHNSSQYDIPNIYIKEPEKINNSPINVNKIQLQYPTISNDKNRLKIQNEHNFFIPTERMKTIKTVFHKDEDLQILSKLSNQEKELFQLVTEKHFLKKIPPLLKELNEPIPQSKKVIQPIPLPPKEVIQPIPKEFIGQIPPPPKELIQTRLPKEAIQNRSQNVENITIQQNSFIYELSNKISDFKELIKLESDGNEYYDSDIEYKIDEYYNEHLSDISSIQ